MNIKSSQVLVEEAKKSIETLSSEDVKNLYDQGEITLIDVRDIRGNLERGTIEKFKTYSERHARILVRSSKLLL